MRLMRLNAVMEKTGLGRSSVYKLIAHGTFPKPVQLGLRSVGWVDLEIEAWIADKIAKRDHRLSHAVS
jgi:prophage regulatory protein